MNPTAESNEAVDALPVFQPPATLGDVWNSNWAAAGVSTPIGVQQPRREATNDLLDAYQRASGKSVFDAASDAGMPISSWAYTNGKLSGMLTSSEQAELTGVARQLAARLPDAQARQVEPFLDVDARAAAKAQAIEAQASDVNARTFGLTDNAAGYVAGLARGLADPSTVAGLLLGGPAESTVGRMLAREFAVNAGFGAAVHEVVTPEREALGLQSASLAGDALSAGLFGAGLAGVLRGASWTLRRAIGRGVGEAAPLGLKPNPAPDPGLHAEAGALAPEDFEAAARLADRDVAIDALAPTQTFEGRAQARSAVDAAATRLETGDMAAPGALPELGAGGAAHPSSPAEAGAVRAAPAEGDPEAQLAAGAAAAALARSDVPAYSPAAAAPAGRDAPAGVFMFDPRQLHVDASRFQFKSGGDEYGVTSALRSVSKWDPAKAQAIIVWEDREGRLWVADGHQRAGLAQRLTAEGKATNIQLPGLLYREADGVSAADVRAIAAVTNIANGSGSAIDGAKVLRARPELLDGSLPLTAGKGQQAAALARLGDEAFAMTVNGVVPEHFAATVGELIPSDAARQVAALKAIVRFKPRNVDEASVLTQRVAAAELSRAAEGRQTSMFGDLETPESTAGQEMRIVGAAIGELKRDKTLFARVVQNAERIEGAGSTIDREASRTRAGDAEVFAKVLASDAYSAGPVRKALTAAARDLHDGNASLSDAAERVLSALRGKIETDGANRAGDRSGPGGEPTQGEVAAGGGAAAPQLAAQRADVERALSEAEASGADVQIETPDGPIAARDALSAIDDFKAAARELAGCILKFGE